MTLVLLNLLLQQVFGAELNQVKYLREDFITVIPKVDSIPRDLPLDLELRGTRADAPFVTNKPLQTLIYM